MTDKTNHLRDYHAPVWDEPVIMQLGYPGRRGQVFPQPSRAAIDKAGAASTLIPKALARTQAPALPEMSEPEVQRHYLHLCQETLGMLNISLFGTCTMKYNARVSEAIAQRPFVAVEASVSRSGKWSDPVRAYVARASGRVVAVER